MKDILGRKKRYVHNSNTKTLKVPHYKGLTIEKIMGWVVEQQDVEHYLPDDEDLPKIPRWWITDVCATLRYGPFREWV